MLAEQFLGLVRAVERLAVAVIARAGVIAADDEVRAAVVLADDGVPQRFARPAHAHGQVQQAQRAWSAPGTAPALLVAAHAGEVVDVAGLGHAHHRVNQQIGLYFARGAEGQFLVGAVHGVTGLEGHHLAPAQLCGIARAVPPGCHAAF